MTVIHAIAAIVASLVVGGGSGYAFRGMIHKEIGVAGQAAQSATKAAGVAAQNEAKKI